MGEINNDSKAVLTTAYHALQEEYDRIEHLLEPNSENPLGEYAGTIGARFTDQMAEARNELASIRAKLEKLGPPIEEMGDQEDNRQEENPSSSGEVVGMGGQKDKGGDQEENPQQILKDCWRDYFDLKTRLMPTLSTDLLAVIGGVYLREKKLDFVRRKLDDFVGQEAVSFSELAEQLVKDLAQRSGKGWESVLIVGEERQTHSEAEIIRLRFPACDIWNLPFTAHEYGYLVARKDTKAPPKFRALRDTVKLNVNPKNHPIASPPEHRECFLPEVVNAWDQYHNELNSDDAREDFLEKNEQRLFDLADQQESYLCRLFADAFATFFVGPAYVLALLHLRFTPRDTPLPGMPSFAQRFLFALETLKWMNEKPIVDAEDNRVVFEEEVFEQGGIPNLWRQTLESLEMEDNYRKLLEKSKFWLHEVKDSLQANFATAPAIGKTYKNWKVANDIKAELLAADPKVAERPDVWAVLNAAWSARWQNTSKLQTIEVNALRLLKDPTVIKTQDARPSAGQLSPKESGSDYDRAVAEVGKALAPEPPVFRPFRAMVKNKHFQKNDDILEALRENDTAYDQYDWLIKNHP